MDRVTVKLVPTCVCDWAVSTLCSLPDRYGTRVKLTGLCDARAHEHSDLHYGQRTMPISTQHESLLGPVQKVVKRPL